MPFIYQADVWCDQCGQHIIADLNKYHAGVPANPSDESSFDSDVYPKPYYPDAEQADSPQTCASGNCGGFELPGGGYGRFLENGLTAEGYKSLKAMLDGRGATLPRFAQEWADFYQFTYFSRLLPEGGAAAAGTIREAINQPKHGNREGTNGTDIRTAQASGAGKERAGRG